MSKNGNAILLVFGLLVIGILVSSELYIFKEISSLPSSYTDCMSIGGFIPKDLSQHICVTENGQVFFDPTTINTTQQKFKIQIDTPIPTRARPPALNGCQIGGCSNELCLEGSDTTTTSTCDIKPHFVCYRNAICERQENGRCGWKVDSVLKSCLESYEKP